MSKLQEKINELVETKQEQVTSSIEAQREKVSAKQRLRQQLLKPSLISQRLAERKSVLRARQEAQQVARAETELQQEARRLAKQQQVQRQPVNIYFSNPSTAWGRKDGVEVVVDPRSPLVGRSRASLSGVSLGQAEAEHYANTFGKDVRQFEQMAVSAGAFTPRQPIGFYDLPSGKYIKSQGRIYEKPEPFRAEVEQIKLEKQIEFAAKPASPGIASDKKTSPFLLRKVSKKDLFQESIKRAAAQKKVKKLEKEISFS